MDPEYYKDLMDRATSAGQHQYAADYRRKWHDALQSEQADRHTAETANARYKLADLTPGLVEMAIKGWGDLTSDTNSRLKERRRESYRIYDEYRERYMRSYYGLSICLIDEEIARRQRGGAANESAIQEELQEYLEEQAEIRAEEQAREAIAKTAVTTWSDKVDVRPTSDLEYSHKDDEVRLKWKAGSHNFTGTFCSNDVLRVWITVLDSTPQARNSRMPANTKNNIDSAMKAERAEQARRIKTAAEEQRKQEEREETARAKLSAWTTSVGVQPATNLTLSLGDTNAELKWEAGGRKFVGASPHTDTVLQVQILVRADTPQALNGLLPASTKHELEAALKAERDEQVRIENLRILERDREAAEAEDKLRRQQAETAAQVAKQERLRLEALAAEQRRIEQEEATENQRRKTEEDRRRTAAWRASIQYKVRREITRWANEIGIPVPSYIIEQIGYELQDVEPNVLSYTTAQDGYKSGVERLAFITWRISPHWYTTEYDMASNRLLVHTTVQTLRGQITFDVSTNSQFRDAMDSEIELLRRPGAPRFGRGRIKRALLHDAKVEIERWERLFDVMCGVGSLAYSIQDHEDPQIIYVKLSWKNRGHDYKANYCQTGQMKIWINIATEGEPVWYPINTDLERRFAKYACRRWHHTRTRR